ncbi:MAG: DUF86 domain-containing protein [Desulfuromonadales bacterium]|nr:DUF86 domain-containing protein [Desulfuromonadales bacterium]
MPEARPSRSVELFIIDIFLAGFRIDDYVKDIADAESLRQDSLRWDATIRQLEIVGEAMGNILKDEVLATSAPDYFRKIVNFRNAITHGYFGIDEGEVWSVIKRHFPVLIEDLHRLISILELNMKRAIELESGDLERLGDRQASEYLRALFH